MLTDADRARLQAARERLAVTTQTKWHHSVNRHPTADGQDWGAMELQAHPAGGAGRSLFTWTGDENKRNSIWIAAAHEDMGWLIELVTEQEKRIETLRQMVHDLGAHPLPGEQE